MKLTYDPEHNIGYIMLREKREPVDTLAISSELNIDISPDGKIYGIELLNANEQLKHQDKLNIVIEHAMGQSLQEIPLENPL